MSLEIQRGPNIVASPITSINRGQSYRAVQVLVALFSLAAGWLAAVGLALIMGLAIAFHIMRGKAEVIALHLVVVGLCAFVAMSVSA
jgi:hypothetical protein